VAAPAPRLKVPPLAIMPTLALCASFLACATDTESVRNQATANPPASGEPKRIVSLVPATTEMLFAMGAGDRLVGVGSYERFPPEVEQIRRVGGLIDPDTEGIIALEPDLVVLYNTQAELKQRLERAGIPFFAYQHRDLQDVMTTIRSLGARVDAVEQADAVAAGIERDLAAVRRSVAGLPRPKTMLVFGRDPGSLRNIYASGGYGFLADLLDVAGGDNVFAEADRESLQIGTETILARRPEVTIELRYGSRNGQSSSAAPSDWNVLASVPAVERKRLYVLEGDEFVVPGPRVVSAARRFAAVLHGTTIK
jgi:iron complex transport system substrate-binding protein